MRFTQTQKSLQTFSFSYELLGENLSREVFQFNNVYKLYMRVASFNNGIAHFKQPPGITTLLIGHSTNFFRPKLL